MRDWVTVALYVSTGFRMTGPISPNMVTNFSLQFDLLRLMYAGHGVTYQVAHLYLPYTRLFVMHCSPYVGNRRIHVVHFHRSMYQ